MIIPTREIKLVHEYLFRNGCMVVEDKPTFDLHPLLPVTNHKVMKVVRSLTSKGVLSRQFIWKHAYYTVTMDGVAWLREKLLLEEDAYPKTHSAMVGGAEKEAVAEGAPAKFRRME